MPGARCDDEAVAGAATGNGWRSNGLIETTFELSSRIFEIFQLDRLCFAERLSCDDDCLDDG